MNNELILSIDALNNYLVRLFPEMQGTGFQLTNDNTIPTRFIFQTPNVWGKDADKVSIDAGKEVKIFIHRLIASAESFIDITTLTPFPDGHFFQAIQEGLTNLANSSKDITVRILAGWPPTPYEGINQHDFLVKLIEPFQSKASNLSIYVGVQRDMLIDGTWNHAKIVAVDGKNAIVGGENLWDANYLGPYPVHDLNVSVNGSAAYYLHKFIDPVWKSVCEYEEDSWKTVHWSLNTGITGRCLSSYNIPNTKGNGTIKILGAGRYGTLESSKKPADKAILYCMNAAQKTINVAQQDLLNQLIPWPDGMEALANAVIRGVNVKIVISNDNAKASATRDPNSTNSDSYSTSTQQHTYDELKGFIEEYAATANLEILGSFELAVLRFGPSVTWPNGWQFANHAKFFMVDDQLFCVGSENLYPANLIEYVLFYEDEKSIQIMKSSYWDQLWQYSSSTKMCFPNQP